MNSSTGKFAKWYVRVIAPKIIDYPIKARGETIAAQKFECVLVSKDSSQYVLGLVPFAFSDRGAAQKAMDKFKENHVFEITQPAFDTKTKSEFNGCPLKTVLLLARPTIVKAPPDQQGDAGVPRHGHNSVHGYFAITARLEKHRLCHATKQDVRLLRQVSQRKTSKTCGQERGAPNGVGG